MMTPKWTEPKTWDETSPRALNLEWWRVLLLVLLAAALGWAAGVITGERLATLLGLLVFGLWTTPKTWTAVVVTVLDLNTHIRDNLNILKTSIADNGDIVAPNAIIGSAQGNRFGTSGTGSMTTPTRGNTNILLYDNGATNWSGIGAEHADGTMYFVTGNTGTPATRLTISPSGGVTIPGLSSLADCVPMLRGYQEKFQTVAAAGTTVIDLAAGNHIILTLGASISAFTITSSLFGLTAGYVQPIVFHIQHDGTARSITWTINGNGVRFSSGAAPTLASANGFITRVVVYYMAGYSVFGEQIGYNG
jgi:hypothetical protein